MTTLLTRRHVLTSGGQLVCATALSTALATALGTGISLLASPTARAAAQLGVLQPADSNGIRLPEGFRSRVVARSLLPVQVGDFEWLDYTWHTYPDGGATFAQPDGIYVSNSETASELGGGALDNGRHTGCRRAPATPFRPFTPAQQASGMRPCR